MLIGGAGVITTNSAIGQTKTYIVMDLIELRDKLESSSNNDKEE